MNHARTRLHRTLAATAVASLCLAPLAACGGSNGSDGSDSDTTSESSSSSSESHDHLTRENFFDEVVDAAVDKKSAHIAMDAGQVKMDGDVEYDGKDTRMHMEMGMGGQELEMVLAEQTAYLKAAGMTPDGKWIKFDKNSRGFGQFVEQMDNLDISSQVETLEKGLKSLEYAGEEKVGGESYEKYKLVVDSKTAFAGKKMPANLPATTSYTMLLDDDHLMRRMVMSVSGQEITMDWTQWGEDVDVTVPKPAEIVDLKLPGAPQPTP